MGVLPKSPWNEKWNKVFTEVVIIMMRRLNTLSIGRQWECFQLWLMGGPWEQINVFADLWPMDEQWEISHFYDQG